MQPIISGREGDRIKIEVTIDLSGWTLEAPIQSALEVVIIHACFLLAG